MSFSVKIKTFHEIYVFPIFFFFFFFFFVCKVGEAREFNVTVNLELPEEGLTVIVLH